MKKSAIDDEERDAATRRMVERMRAAGFLPHEISHFTQGQLVQPEDEARRAWRAMEEQVTAFERRQQIVAAGKPAARPMATAKKGSANRRRFDPPLFGGRKRDK